MRGFRVLMPLRFSIVESRVYHAKILNLRPRLFSTEQISKKGITPMTSISSFNCLDSESSDEELARRSFTIQANEHDLTVNYIDGRSESFHYKWLRDHCLCSECLHPRTKQRQVDTFNIPLDLKPISINYTPNEPSSITLKWRDSEDKIHISVFDSNWLKNTGIYKVKPPEKILWDTTIMNKDNYPSLSALPVLDGNKEVLKEALMHLRDYGFCMIRDMPSNMEATEKFARRIGFPKETIYGVMWDTHIKDDQTINDTAFSSAALELHTDCTYMRDPPGLQAFNCVKNSAKGGISRFADGYKIMEIIKSEHPDTYKYLLNTPVPWWCKDVDHTLEIEAPVIKLNLKGKYDMFRFNNDDRACLSGLSSTSTMEFYKHWRILQGILREKKNVFEILLNPGMMVMIDNQRVLHGRTKFEGTDRNLMGFYMDRDIVESRMTMLGIAL